MGWCAEFGCGIEPSCDHPMVAGRQSCSCEVCGVGCAGRFPGCREVWAAGPKTRPARKRGSRSIPVAAGVAGPAVQGVPGIQGSHIQASHIQASQPMAAALPDHAAAPRAVVLDDDRLRSMSETVDRMGRQLRGVVKLLNQQPAQPPQAAPGPSVDDARIVALGETVERMGRELRGVLNLLIQQQAILAKMAEGRSPALGPEGPPPTPAGLPGPARPTGIGGVQRRPRPDAMAPTPDETPGGAGPGTWPGTSQDPGPRLPGPEVSPYRAGDPQWVPGLGDAP
jgi:hypothetical protein